MTSSLESKTSDRKPGPRRRSDGEQSHREILRAAAELASVEGLEGLSIAALADRVGLSKSGLYAHFGSKEDLQLETIEAALEVFGKEVVRPALAEPPGLARLRAYARNFLSHVGGRTYPGGCFFASVGAEVDSRPGPLRDRIAAIHRDWTGRFERCVIEAQTSGALDGRAEPRQVAFEVTAMLAGAHASFLLQGDVEALERCRSGIEHVLAAYAPRR
jgi:AcrR family transcriptional regulator